jgi:hypothetical protein
MISGIVVFISCNTIAEDVGLGLPDTLALGQAKAVPDLRIICLAKV